MQDTVYEPLRCFVCFLVGVVITCALVGVIIICEPIVYLIFAPSAGA